MIHPGAKFRSVRLSAVCALTLSCALAAAAGPRTDTADTASSKSTPTKSKKTASSSRSSHSASTTSAKRSSSKTSGKRSSHRKTSRSRGQQKIDSERALAIQQALVREHYLTGEPTGAWNQASEDAMRRYQADHGWQSKTVPDSRALISLGLGPSKDHLLNPESAMTTVPDPPKSSAPPATSHSATPVADPAPATSTAPATASTPSPDGAASPQ